MLKSPIFNFLWALAIVILDPLIKIFFFRFPIFASLRNVPFVLVSSIKAVPSENQISQCFPETTGFGIAKSVLLFLPTEYLFVLSVRKKSGVPLCNDCNFPQ